MDRPSMRKFVECDPDSGELILHSDEKIITSFKQIEASFSNVIEEILGNFDLTITSSRLVLLNESSSFEFDIPFIGLHAISRDPNSYHKPCIYCQLDQDDDEQANELFLAPALSSALNTTIEDILKNIFDSLCEAASLNPDPIEEGHDGLYGEGDLIYDIDEVNLGAQQASMLAHLESCFQEPDSMTSHSTQIDSNRFENAEEDDNDNDKLEPPKKK